MAFGIYWFSRRGHLNVNNGGFAVLPVQSQGVLKCQLRRYSTFAATFVFLTVPARFMKLIRSFHRKPCSAYSEEDLLSMIRQRNADTEKALDCLYERNFDMARHALQEHRLDEADVLEVYADTLLAVRDNIWAGRYEQRGSLRAFFGMTFRNKCIDKIRRNATKQKRDDETRKEQPNEPEPTPYHILELQEEANEEARQTAQRNFCLGLALHQLSERERDIMTDYFINDLKPAAIADKYGFKTSRVVSTTVYNLKTKLEDAIRQVCAADPRCSLLCSSSQLF